MKKIKIQDLMPGLVTGIEVLLPTKKAGFKENYFEWTASPLVAKFATNEISGGILESWHHVPVFTEIETHVDNEMFYFISGIARMLFIDMKNGKPDINTAQVVRILPGTQIIISPGKAHFVPVAEDSMPFFAVVVSPKMAAPRISLLEPVEGIE
ncbi:MAG TPA: hypothetical protein DDW50_07550 [Firmicutes bacterium]|jgi:hypothetical protein|nr:hypothetical protein [Bacillota bacterium]